MQDIKNLAIGIHTVIAGNRFSRFISTCETFKSSILANAEAIIVAHNQPSGDITPSLEDVQVTETLKVARKLLDIEVLALVILDEDGRWNSLKRLGHL